MREKKKKDKQKGKKKKPRVVFEEDTRDVVRDRWEPDERVVIKVISRNTSFGYLERVSIRHPIRRQRRICFFFVFFFFVCMFFFRGEERKKKQIRTI